MTYTKDQIAAALMIWVNCGMNGAKASALSKVNYFTLNQWIIDHYMPLKQSKNTITLTIPSKV